MPSLKRMTRTQFAKATGLTARQVIYGLRLGRIKGEQVGGWVWTIPDSEVERVKQQDWYKKAMAKRIAAA